MKIQQTASMIKNRALGFIKRAAKSEGAAASYPRKKNVLLALYIVIILLVNVVGLTLNFRCDLTRNRTYSLSQKSRDIVSNLKENMKIKVLFSKDLPAQHSAIVRYLQDLLEEYSYYGNEYFSYEIVRDKDVEKQAGDYGIQPIQSQELANDQVNVVRQTYMALVIQQSDLVEKIPAITDPTGLEYRITSLMEKMSSKIDGLLSLKQPIQVLLFMDSRLKSLPVDGIETLDKKVKETVDKCNANNYDKLRFKLIDPSEDKTGMVSAEMFGIPKLKWNGGHDRSGRAIQAGEAHFGIILKNQDRVAAVELSVAPTLVGKNVIMGVDKLEDRINKAIGSLVSSNPRIGYVTGHDEVNLNDQQSREGGGYLRQILSDVYEVREIDLAKEDIPADLGLIIINGPRKEFTGAELYKIDQFLMQGKSAIFFIDSFAEVRMGQQNPFARRQPIILPVNTGLDPLLKAYGVTVNRDIVLDSSCAKGQIAGTIRDIYFVPIIKKKGFNKDNVITKYLKGAAFFKASSIDVDTKKIKALNLSWSDLVSSSDESWKMTGQINMNPFFMSQPQNKADMKKSTLAALVSGRFESYFKTREAPAAADRDRVKKDIASVARKLDGTITNGTSRIIVVGTSEITRSEFLMNARRLISSSLTERDEHDRIFANGFLIHSMADYLLDNSYIPEMSRKSLDYNPLEKTTDRGKKTIKAINIAGVPLLVIIAGFFIWKKRQKRKKRLMEEFSQGGKA